MRPESSRTLAQNERSAESPRNGNGALASPAHATVLRHKPLRRSSQNKTPQSAEDKPEEFWTFTQSADFAKARKMDALALNGYSRRCMKIIVAKS